MSRLVQTLLASVLVGALTLLPRYSAAQDFLFLPKAFRNYQENGILLEQNIASGVLGEGLFLTQLYDTNNDSKPDLAETSLIRGFEGKAIVIENVPSAWWCDENYNGVVERDELYFKVRTQNPLPEKKVYDPLNSI